MATYASGGMDTFRSHNFVSFQELHKPEIDSKLVTKFNESLSGLLKMVGAVKPTKSIKYTRYEKDRIMPKVLADNNGATPAAGASATFTLASSAQTSFGSFSPYDTGVSHTTGAVPVRKYDLIMIPPATGIASADSYVKALVTSVTPGSSPTFAATPLDSTKTIPTIANTSPVEIVIYGNAHGEGTGFQKGLVTKVTPYTESLQIVKHKMVVTGTEKLQAEWVDEAKTKAMLKGEADAYMQMLNFVDLTCLVGEKISNTALAELFVDGTLEDDAPIDTTNGAITQALDGGNTLNYSSITGLTIADLYNYITVIDKQSAEKSNMLNVGIELDMQLDRELGNRVSNGAISYGMFKFGQEKAIDLGFNKVKLGSYTFEKRCLKAMNDLQTLGADNFDFPYEALMLPMGTTKVDYGDEQGAIVPTLRKRYLANYGESREMKVVYYDGLRQSESGLDREEVRYQAHVGMELIAKNKSGYWKRA